MNTTSGILGLARGMRAYFASVLQSPPNIIVGWTKRWRQDNQGAGGAARIVLMPGVVDVSAGPPKVLPAGTIDRDFEQNFVDLNPQMRIVRMWHYAVTCSVWAVDPNYPQDEEAQIGAVEDLLELTYQSIAEAYDPVTGFTVGAGNIEDVGAPVWTLPPGESPFGRELTFGFVLRVPLFAQPVQKAFPLAAVARNPAA